MSVLEYIHENEYVHADIKAANLLLGYRNPEQVKLDSAMNMMCYIYLRGIKMIINDLCAAGLPG